MNSGKPDKNQGSVLQGRAVEGERIDSGRCIFKERIRQYWIGQEMDWQLAFLNANYG
jgi:hypothetical protein